MSEQYAVIDAEVEEVEEEPVVGAMYDGQYLQEAIAQAYGSGVEHALNVAVIAIRQAALKFMHPESVRALNEVADGFQEHLDKFGAAAPPEQKESTLWTP